MEPYYRVHSMSRTIDVFNPDGEIERIDLDPNQEYKINILWVMPNSTARVEIKNNEQRWNGLIQETRQIQIANLELVFDGRFNDDQKHSYVTKKDVANISIFTVDGWKMVKVSRSKVKILERTDLAMKVEVEGQTGWTRSFLDVELTNFGYLFDGRFNEPEKRRVNPDSVPRDAVLTVGKKS